MRRFSHEGFRTSGWWAAWSLILTCAVAVYGAVVPDPTGPLNAAQTHQFDSLSTRFIMQDNCCNRRSLRDCHASTRCASARRMHTFGQWLVHRNMQSDSLLASLDLRQKSILSDSTFPIISEGYPTSGAPDAPVCITVYFSSFCPLCKHLLAALDSSVTTGELRGRARVVAKPFSTDFASINLMATHRHGLFWQFIRGLIDADTRPSQPVFDQIAANLGADAIMFKNAQKDTLLHRRCLLSRQEAVDNNVSVTPTIFINNVRYRSYKGPRWVIDAAQYRYELFSAEKVGIPR